MATCKTKQEVLKEARANGSSTEHIKNLRELVSMREKGMLLTPEEDAELADIPIESTVVESQVVDRTELLQQLLEANGNDGTLSLSFNGSTKSIGATPTRLVQEGTEYTLTTDNGTYVFEQGNVQSKPVNGKYVTVPAMILTKSTMLGSREDIKVGETVAWDKFAELEAGIHGDSSKMVDLLDKLHELGGNKETDAHMEHLRGLLTSMDPEFFKKMKTYVMEGAKETGGVISSEVGNEGIGIMLSKASRLAGNQQSEAEVYAHEIVHAYTMFAVQLAKDGDLAARKMLRELQYLKKVAMEHTKWQEFLPKESIDAKLEEANAKEMYDYIFGTNVQGKKDWKPSENAEDEFIAHVLTNPIVMAKMKHIKLKEESKDQSLWGRVKEMFKDITSWLSGDFKFADRTKNIQELTTELAFKFAEYNNKAVNKARNQAGLIERLGEAFTELEDSVAQKLHEGLNKVLPVDKQFGPPPTNPLGRAAWHAKVWTAMITNPIHRPQLVHLLNAYGIKSQGTIQSILRDFVESDALEKSLDWLALNADKVDQGKMNVSNTVSSNIRDGFSRKLTVQEEELITKILLDTDMQSIKGKYINKQLRNMLENDTELNRVISRAKHKLKMLDKKNYNWHVSQAEGLGYYLAVGKAHIAQNFNASNIARGLLGFDYKRPYVKRRGDLDSLIDEVATLVALKHTGKLEKKQMADLMADESKGVKRVLDTARFLKTEAKEKLFKGQEVFQAKGYTKELFDSSITMEIAPMKDRAKMEQNGFKFVSKVDKHSQVKTKEEYGMFVSDSFETQEWYRSATRLTKMHTKGTTLGDIHYGENDKYSMKRHKIDKLRIDSERYKMVAEMKDGTFDPTKAEFGLAPVLNEYGDVSDYRYIMDKNSKKELLKQDTTVSEVMGATRGSILDKESTEEHNKDVLKLITDDAKENYIAGMNVGKNNIAYTVIKDGSEDPEIQDLWNVLPKSFKDAARRNIGGGLAVRQDMLHNYFGYRHFSMGDVKWLKLMTPAFVHRAIKIAEAIWMEFIKIVKVDILIKMPAVIVGNILSNIVYAITTGSSPLEILNMYRESTRDVRNYLTKHRELVSLQERLSIGEGNQKDKNRVVVLQHELQSNPVHELYELGMYQAIVEDISKEELSNTNKLKKMYNEKTKIIPKVIKDGMNWMYLTEETQYYKFMTEVLQMSDLIARDIENRKLKKISKLQAEGSKKLPNWYINHISEDKSEFASMLRIKKGDQLTNRSRKMSAEEKKYFMQAADEYRKDYVLNAFVNYNKPSGNFEEYLNKMGFIMFTKYAKRIQRVIADTAAKHPLRSMAALLVDSYLVDMDIIQDQSIFTRSWYNMTPQWPIDRLLDVFTPPIVQASTYQVF